MWDLNCGCVQLVPEKIIYNIPDDCNKIIYKKSIIPKDILSNNTAECLKQTAIQEFLDSINALECGLHPNIENLLQEIALLDIKYDIPYKNITYHV